MNILSLKHRWVAKQMSCVVASLGVGGRDRPEWHHPWGWHPNKSLIFCGCIYKEHWINDQLECGESGQWWRRTTMTKKVMTFLRKKKFRVTPVVTAPTLVTPLVVCVTVWNAKLPRHIRSGRLYRINSRVRGGGFNPQTRPLNPPLPQHITHQYLIRAYDAALSVTSSPHATSHVGIVTKWNNGDSTTVRDDGEFTARV